MNEKKAILAGGCFWCLEAAYERLPGIIAVESGYSGGFQENPTYEQVCTGLTGHAEAVRISFDSGEISFGEILTFSGKSTIRQRKTVRAPIEGSNIDRSSSIWTKTRRQSPKPLAAPGRRSWTEESSRASKRRENSGRPRTTTRTTTGTTRTRRTADSSSPRNCRKPDSDI